MVFRECGESESGTSEGPDVERSMVCDLEGFLGFDAESCEARSCE